MTAVPSPLAALLDRLVNSLKGVYGTGLVSVILYGSAAGGEYHPGHSDVNVLVVLDDAGLPSIGRAHRLFSGRAFRDIRPLFFTEDYIRTSLDVFPIEFLDMKEHYTLLHGTDVLQGAAVDTRNLRFQCEQELKSRLITLRGAYLRAAGGRAARDLLFRSFTSVIHLLRNVLRLNGMTPPYRRDELIAALERNLAIDGSALRDIHDARTSGMRLSHREADSLLAGLAATLERVIALVDRS